MKKPVVLALIAVVLVIIVIAASGGNSSSDAAEGEVYQIASVDGNTITTTLGPRIKLLGIKEGSKQAEQFIRNNYLDADIEVVYDARSEAIVDQDSEIYAYVTLPGHDDACLNRLILDQYRSDVWDAAFVTDSLTTFTEIIATDRSAAKIADLALFMKQRTFLIQVPGGIGTGFFINDQGLAVTNNHVLSDAQGVVWLYSDDPDDAKVYTTKRRGIKRIDWTNPQLDITIFTVDLDNDERVPYFNLADRHARQGDEVSTLGNPHGLTASYSGGGNVAAYRLDPYQPDRGVTVMQYNIPTNGGNSGGPVCLPNGLVYAVHEMGDKTMQGTNYGIDILHVREVLDAAGLKYGGK